MISIKTLTDEELCSLISAAHMEREERVKRKERQAWQQVVEAMKNYIENYRNIEVNGSGAIIQIDSMAVFDDGVIITED